MKFTLKHGHWNAARKRRFITPHTNNGLELVMIRHGAVDWDCVDTVVHAPAGSVFFTWPWQCHSAHDEQLPLTDIYWVILPLLPEDATAQTLVNQLRLRLPRTIQGSRDFISTLRRAPEQVLKLKGPVQAHFIRLVERLQATGGALDMMATGWLHLLLAGLLEAAHSASSLPTESADHQRVKKFIQEALPATLAEPWSLARMAAACDLGRTRFAACVKDIQGETPLRALKRLRITAAQMLLRTTVVSVTAIALDCGFTSSQHFATAFRAHVGESPGAYRRRPSIITPRLAKK